MKQSNSTPPISFWGLMLQLSLAVWFGKSLNNVVIAETPADTKSTQGKSAAWWNRITSAIPGLFVKLQQNLKESAYFSAMAIATLWALDYAEVIFLYSSEFFLSWAAFGELAAFLFISNMLLPALQPNFLTTSNKDRFWKKFLKGLISTMIFITTALAVDALNLFPNWFIAAPSWFIFVNLVRLSFALFGQSVFSLVRAILTPLSSTIHEAQASGMLPPNMLPEALQSHENFSRGVWFGRAKSVADKYHSAYTPDPVKDPPVQSSHSTPFV